MYVCIMYNKEMVWNIVLYFNTVVQGAFMNFDRDCSGTVEPHELQQALVTFGYSLNPMALGIILRRYSTDGRVAFDAFVSLCVRLKALTCKRRKFVVAIIKVSIAHCLYT